MGCYIETPSNHKKAIHIISEHGARSVTQEEAAEAMERGEGVICVVDNGIFEAAGFCFNAREFEAFTEPHDTRPRTFLVMDRAKAEELSGFSR